MPKPMQDKGVWRPNAHDGWLHGGWLLYTEKPSTPLALEGICHALGCWRAALPNEGRVD